MKKKCKVKETFKDNLIQLNEFIVEIKSLDEEIDTLKKDLIIKEKKRNQLFKQFNTRFKTIEKMYNDDIIIPLTPIRTK